MNDTYEKHKKVLVVCQYYFPENFQITPICEALADDGYNVTVLTGLPNYPDGVIPQEYKKGHRKEIRNGVKILRVYEKGRKKGAIGLAVNYISFVLSANRAVRHLKDDYDVVFCYQLSPVIMAVPAIRYARKHEKPYIHYVCDLWPESMKMLIKGEDNPMFRIVDTISRRIYRAADRIIIQSTSFAGYLEETHGIAFDKMSYIPAFSDDRYLKQDFTPKDDNTDFVFMGNLGIAQDLISVLKAIEEIKGVPGFTVHFVGDGVCLNEMKEYVSEHGLEEKVIFYGRRPVEEMTGFYKLADACLVTLKADSAIGYTLPTKVQGYMAAGKPIIGMIDGSASTVIHEAKCGGCVPAGDVDGLGKLMLDFIENSGAYEMCGKNGREYFRKHFAKDVCIKKIEGIIDEISDSRL